MATALGPMRDNEVTHAQFRALANSMPTLAWMAHPDGWIFWYNRRWYEYTGTTPDDMAGWGWQSVHHPDILPEVLLRWTQAITRGEPFEMVFPLLGADGVFRPFLTRIKPLFEDRKIVGWLGTNTEITEQERARERLQLMVHELNHRVKNTLATVQSIASQTFREAPLESRQTFDERLIALSRVHDILTRESWGQAALHDVVVTALACAAADRFTVNGPDVLIDPPIASGLAMTLHELCTNALKYGALSVAGGSVAIEWKVETGAGVPNSATLEWSECGGPAVVQPTKTGFGLRLITRVMGSDRGARVAHRFEPDGVRCTISFALGKDVLQ